MQAERYMVNLNFMTIQCISFLAKRENIRKFSTVFFSRSRQFFFFEPFKSSSMKLEQSQITYLLQ